MSLRDRSREGTGLRPGGNTEDRAPARPSLPANALDPPGIFEGSEFVGLGPDSVRRVRQYASVLRGGLITSYVGIRTARGSPENLGVPGRTEQASPLRKHLLDAPMAVGSIGATRRGDDDH